jgi:hypothetical protein
VLLLGFAITVSRPDDGGDVSGQPGSPPPSLTYWQQIEKKMRYVLHSLLSGIQQCAVAISPI